ncbi:hypothetical protein C8Q74DRAFT_459574 [Fomes fomentarius]|nr:hypothetical protein C8Q74DRAFT_459574 [Fomes fomentarius]
MHALEHTLRKPSEEELRRQHAAATCIQKAYRKRLRGTYYLAPDFLWTDLATHAQMKVERDAAEQGRNSSRDRWRRSVFLLGRLQDGNDSLSQVKSDRGEATLKHLETQHWLELIDGKHRYGSN